MSCRCKKNRINKYVDVSNIRPREWNEAESILGLSHCGDIMAYDKPEFEMTEDDRDKLDQVVIDGEGDKALYDDGEYKHTYTAEEVDTKLEDYYTKEEVDTTLEDYYTKEDIAEVLEDAVFYEDDQINTRNNINLAENSKITGKQTGVNGNQQFDLLETSEFGTIHVGSPLVSLNVRSNKRPTAQVTMLNQTANEEFAYLSDIESLGEDLGGDLEGIKEGLQQQIDELDEKLDGHISEYDEFAENVNERFGNVNTELSEIRTDVAENASNIATNTSDIEGLRNDFNTSSKFKGYFEENNDILALEGEEGAYAWSAESGTVWVYDNDLKTWSNSGVKIPDQTVNAYNGLPLVDGEANSGTSLEYARGDHRHPTDESRAAKTDLDDYLALAGNTESTQMTGDIWLGTGNKVRLNESGNSSLSQDTNTQTTILQGNGGGGIDLKSRNSTVKYNGKEVAVVEQVAEVKEELDGLRVDVEENSKNITINTSDIEGLRNDFNASDKFKGYFETNVEIQAIEGKEGAYAWSAESGTVWVYDNNLKTWKQTDKSIPDQTVAPYESLPLVDGEADAGAANQYARGDHRHPTDLSRAAVTDLDNYLALEGNTVDTPIFGDVFIKTGKSLHLSETKAASLSHDLTTQTTIISGDGIGGIDLQAGEVKYNGDKVATVKEVKEVEDSLEAARSDLQSKLDATNEKVNDNKEAIEANKDEFDTLLGRFNASRKFLGYFETSVEIQAIAGEGGAYAWNAETGTVWTYEVENATWTDSGVAIPDQTVLASDIDPLMDGVAASGASKEYSRADHVHPTDTTRAAVKDLEDYLQLAGNTKETKMTGNVFFEAGKKVYVSETVEASLSQDITTQTTILENNGGGGIDFKTSDKVKYNGDEIATVNNVNEAKSDLQTTCDGIASNLEATRDDLQSKIDATNVKVKANEDSIKANKEEFDTLLGRFDIAPKFVGYFETNIQVTEQAAEKGAYAWNAETGTVWKYDFESATWADSEIPIPDQTVDASDADPLMDGVAKAGTSDEYSRADHVHPTDTSRAAVTDLDNYLALEGNTQDTQMKGDIWLGIGNQLHLNESGKSFISQDSDEQAVVLHSNGGGGINLETDFGTIKYNGKEIAKVEDVDSAKEELSNKIAEANTEIEKVDKRVDDLTSSVDTRFDDVVEELSEVRTQVTANTSDIDLNKSNIESLQERFNLSAKFKGYFNTIVEINQLEGEIGTYAWCAETLTVWMYDSGNQVWYNSGKEVPDQTVEAYDGLPLMDSEAEAGSSTQYARGDHRHPTDTSRAAKTDLDNYLSLAGNTQTTKMDGDIWMSTGNSVRLNNSGDTYIQLEENSQQLTISTQGANGIDFEAGTVKYNGDEIATVNYVDSVKDSLNLNISGIESDIEDLEASLNERIGTVEESAKDAHERITEAKEGIEAVDTKVDTFKSTLESNIQEVESGIRSDIANDLKNYLPLEGNTETTPISGDVFFKADNKIQLSETTKAYLSHEGTPQTTILANNGAGGIDLVAGKVKYNGKEIATKDDFDFPSIEDFSTTVADLESSINAVDEKVDNLSSSVDSRFTEVNTELEKANIKISKNETDIEQNSSDIKSLSTAFNTTKKFKGYFETSAEITNLEGEAGAYAWCAATGKVWVYDSETENPSWRETDQKIPDQTVAPYEGLPLMDDTAEKGTADEYARGDHRHPTDSSRAAVTYVDSIKESLSENISDIESDIEELETSLSERIGTVEGSAKDAHDKIDTAKEEIKTVNTKVDTVKSALESNIQDVESGIRNDMNAGLAKCLPLAGNTQASKMTGNIIFEEGSGIQLGDSPNVVLSYEASTMTTTLRNNRAGGIDLVATDENGTVKYNGDEIATVTKLESAKTSLGQDISGVKSDVEELGTTVNNRIDSVVQSVIEVKGDLKDTKDDVTALRTSLNSKIDNVDNKLTNNYLPLTGGAITGDLTVKGAAVVVNTAVNASELMLQSDSITLSSTHASLSALHLYEGDVKLTGDNIELKANSGTASYNGNEIATVNQIPTDYVKETTFNNTVKRIDTDIDNLKENVETWKGEISDDINVIRSNVSANASTIENTVSDLLSLRTDFNASSKFKGYFETSSEVQTLAAEEGAYAWCAETGTVWMYLNNAWANSGKKVPDQTVPASDSLPLVDGQANAGTAEKYARGDHRHPSDTSKQDKLVDGVSIKTLNGQPILGSGNIVINQDNIVNLVQLTGSDSTAIMSQLAVTNAINTVDKRFDDHLPMTGGNLSGELKVKGDSVVVNGTNGSDLKLNSESVRLNSNHTSPSWLYLQEGNVELVGNKAVAITASGSNIDLNTANGTVNYNGKEVATTDQMTTVIDNLNSTSNGDALSANQGRVLKAEIDALKAIINSITPVAVQESTPTSAGVITLPETPKQIVMVSYGRLALFNSDYTTNGSTLTITNSDITISTTDKVKVVYTKSL